MHFVTHKSGFILAAYGSKCGDWKKAMSNGVLLMTVHLHCFWAFSTVWTAVAVCGITRTGERKRTALRLRIKAMLAVDILRAEKRSVRLIFSISE